MLKGIKRGRRIRFNRSLNVVLASYIALTVIIHIQRQTILYKKWLYTEWGVPHGCNPKIVYFSRLGLIPGKVHGEYLWIFPPHKVQTLMTV